MLHVTIIGMGLIGTSLGMALRSADEKDAPLGKILLTGYDKNPRAVTDARGRLAIDREARTLKEALHEAQLVIVAVPVQAVRQVFEEIGPLLPNGAVVTDVASTKAQVVAWARELLPRTVQFIGGHPMAGREKSGPQAAERTLFERAIYCATPTSETGERAMQVLEALVEQIGAKLYYIDAAEHDAYVAGVSHLPFVLSAVLVDAVSRSAGWKEMQPLASTGFRDISRLASGDVEMHRDICLTNHEALVRWIDEATSSLMNLREAIETQDSQALTQFFEQAQAGREEWLQSKPNMRPGEEFFENFGAGQAADRPSLFGRWGKPKQK
jgi:prephenate dehydrogenase